MPQEKATIHQLYAVPNADRDGFEQDFADTLDARDESESCPICFGAGLEIVAGRGARPCECRRAKSHSSQIEKAKIPRRYENCHFQNYKAMNPSQERAYKFAWKLTMDYPAVERGLLLMGSVGVGKTHLAISILKGLTERKFSCRFYEFGALLKEIQNSYNPVSKVSELKVLQPIFDAEILVLDEIGASKPTDWVKDTMAHIINTRYNDKKLTIFTTNYLDERKAGREETLEDRIGVRLRSRLFEMCKTVQIEGCDFRKTFDQIPQIKR
ncbi:MAG: ATP-binding protein [Pyrinomonadaceae bacterium]